MKTFKRLMACMLSVAMVATMVPGTAFAGEEKEPETLASHELVHYTFDAIGEGGVVENKGSLGAEFNGTVFGEAATLQEDAIAGKSIYLGGDGGANKNYVEFAANAMPATEDFTISTWVKYDATPAGWRTLFTAGDASANGGRNEGGNTMLIMTSSDADPRGVKVATAMGSDEKGKVWAEKAQGGQWTQMTFAVSGSTVSYYLNGTKVGDFDGLHSDRTAFFKEGNLARLFGTTKWPDWSPRGKVDDFVVYDKALTAEEVSTTYAEGTAAKDALATVLAAKNGLSFSDTTVREDITLPTTYDGDNDVTISWASSNEDVISTTGVVTRPSTLGAAMVTLTATIAKGDVSVTKDFTFKVPSTAVFNIDSVEKLEARHVRYNTSEEDVKSILPNKLVFKDEVDENTVEELELPVTWAVEDGATYDATAVGSSVKFVGTPVIAQELADEIKNTANTKATVDIKVAEEGLIAEYASCDADNDTAFDLFRTHNAALLGDASVSSEGGMFHGTDDVRAFKFTEANEDGKNQGLQIDGSVIDGVRDVTINLWVKVNSIKNWTTIMDISNAGGYATMAVKGDPNGIGPVGLTIAMKKGDAAESRTYATTQNILPTEEWKMVTYTQEENTGKLYIDGVKVAENQMNFVVSDFIDNNGKVTFGKSVKWPDPSVNGGIDEVQIYNKALTAEQIATKYASNKQAQKNTVDAIANGLKIANQSFVTGDVTLPTTDVAGAEITWASGNEAVITKEGKLVSRPKSDAAAKIVTLTATVTYEGLTATKDIRLMVQPEESDYVFVSANAIDDVNVAFGTEKDTLVFPETVVVKCTDKAATDTTEVTDVELAVKEWKGEYDAKKPGTYTFTAEVDYEEEGIKTAEGSAPTAFPTMNVVVGTNPATALVVTPATITLNPGKTATIKATVTPADTTDVVGYTTSNAKVATVDAKGVVKAVAAGTATITVKAGTITKTVKVTVNDLKPAKVTGIKAKQVKKNKQVTISWKKASNAKGYYVYRSTKKNKNFKKIGMIKKAATVKFTDKKGLKAKKTYYYRVVAFNGKVVGANSAVAKVKIK